MNPTTLSFLRSRQPASLSLEDHNRHVVACALMETFGNISEACRLLDISRRTLHRMIKRWPDLTPRRPETAAEKRVRKWRRKWAAMSPEKRAAMTQGVEATATVAA